MSRLRATAMLHQTPTPSSTEWSLRSPEERAAIVNAPFPTIRRIPGKTWAGTIVVDDTDDPVLRQYQAVRESSTDSTFDNIVKNLEGGQ